MKTYLHEFEEKTQDWNNRYRKAGVAPNIPVLDLEERLRAIERRLCIIEKPATEDLVNFPALAEAYNEYKTIERLILGSKIET